MCVRLLLFILAIALVWTGVHGSAAHAAGPDRMALARLSGPATPGYGALDVMRPDAASDAALRQMAPVLVADGGLLDRTALIGRIFVALGALLTIASAARMLVL